MNETPPAPQLLPKALWIGTGVFAVAAALALTLLLHKGEERAEAESTTNIEGQSVTLNAEQMKRLRREAAPARRRGR